MALRVFLTGGTGTIGRRIVQRLLARGDEPIILSRKADETRRNKALRSVRVIQGDPGVAGDWAEAVDGCDAVINLAGANLFARRWTPAFKDEIRDSRVRSTEQVARAIASAARRPQVLVQASAIGYYGPCGDEDLTEACPGGSDFMARICREWEEAAAPVAAIGVRLATIRTGVVLVKGEGALGVMAPIFRIGGAAPVGSGKNPLTLGKGEQWLSWIHLDDIVGIFLAPLTNPEATGPIDGTAPNPCRNVDFSRALAKALHRPMLPFGPPDALLRAMLGEVATAVIKGQKVLPAKAEAFGYRFEYPTLPEALAAAFARPTPASDPAPAAEAHASRFPRIGAIARKP